MKQVFIKFLVIALLFTLTSNAQDRYWVASATGNWNDTANWSTTSGGAGGASVPGASDYAIFDANGTGNCNVDIAVSLDRFAMNGFVGTVDLNGNDITVASGSANMTFATGTLNDTSSTASLNITSTAFLYFSGTTFGAEIDVSGGRIYLNGSTFNEVANIKQTVSSGQGNSSGGNTFNAAVTIENQGTGWIYLASTNPDVYNAPLTLKTTAGRIYASRGAIGTQYNDNVVLESTGGAQLHFGNNGGTSILADGKTISIGPGGFTSGNLHFNNFTQLGTISQNITMGGSSRIYFKSGNIWNAPLTVEAPRIYLDGSTFNEVSYFKQTIASGEATGSGGNTFNAATTIENTGAGRIGLANTNPDVFNSILTLKCTAGQIYASHAAIGTQYNDDVILESTGGASLSFGNNGGTSTLADGKTISIGAGGFTAGGLSFNNFTQLGTTSQNLSLGGTLSTIAFHTGNVWNGPLTVESPRIALNGSTFNGSCSFTKTGGNYDTSAGGNTFNDTVYLENNSSSYYWVLAGTNPDIFNGEVTFHSKGGRIVAAQTAVGTQFNDNIFVETTGSGTGVHFGTNGGTATLADTKTITVGSNGFTTGDLIFANFTQVGTTAQSLITTGNTNITFREGTTWNGPITASTFGLNLSGSTFNNTADLTHGDGYDNGQGGCTFNGTTTIASTGNNLSLATVNPDVFNGDVTFRTTSAGADISIAHTASNTEFHGDVHFDGQAGHIAIGANGGSVVLKGNNNQTFSKSATTDTPCFPIITLDKTGGTLTLDTPIKITSNINFIGGIIHSTATNGVTITDDASATGASENSHVDGPVSKTGDDAFIFPVGHDRVYQPIGISTPSTNTDTFTASFINMDSNTSYSHTLKDASINHLSTTQYWTLDRDLGSSEVDVTLYWSNNDLGVSDVSDIVVAGWDGSQWKDYENALTTGDINDGTVTSDLPISSYGPFAIGAKASTLGVNEVDNEDIIGVYPNPVTDNLYVNMKNLDISNMRMYSINGQDVTSNIIIRSLDVNSVEIYCERLASGPYLLSINGNLKVILKK